MIYAGRDLLRRFVALHTSASCRDIRGRQRLPLRCIAVIREAGASCAQTMGSDCSDVLGAESQRAYAELYAHWQEQGFHCAHAVLRACEPAIVVGDELLDASSGFVGGTVLTGMTCSALTAGVMALGLARGEIEHSRLRVLRMIGKMACGGDAFADDVNAFNKVMNLGHRLAHGFAAKFGSTQCRAITQCDFATAGGVRRYIDGGGSARCQAIARWVADEVRRLIEATDSPLSARNRAAGGAVTLGA